MQAKLAETEQQATPRPERRRTERAGLAGASAFGSEVRFTQADAGECHGNVAALWIDGAIASIGTGYALVMST